ncbi:MAG: alpha/beta hydrolase-fold protein [Arcicella sp.]|nr:alpha/beta hydrolase-fold protein [Arcicella sp.]
MKKTILFFIVATLSLNAFGQDAAKINQRDSLKIGEHTRSFLFHIPSNITKKPKLLFVIHGSDGTGELMVKFTDGWFGKLADERGDVIVVYPNGYKKHWNDCRKEANFDANLENIDDNTFFKEVINYFVKNYGVDTKQVFAAGHSNGGHQVFKLAKEMPQYFRKFAAVSANLPTPSNEDCFATGKPVSMLVINGTGDAINPYNGGEVVLPGDAKRGNVISTNETMNYWAGLAKINFATASRF